MSYTAIFDDASQFNLYHEGYFNDKGIFWLHHQSNLIAFGKEVCIKGRPKEILIRDENHTVRFDSSDEFDTWYLQHQSNELDFGFSHLLKEEQILSESIKRIKNIIDLLGDKIRELRKTEIFSPWSVNGGYKDIEHRCWLGIKSLEAIELKHGANNIYDQMKSIFAIPVIDNVKINLVSYSNLHDRINHEELLARCEECRSIMEKNLRQLKR